MREQRITIRIGVAKGDPDAHIALRSALNIVMLLEGVDEAMWRLRTPRYTWRIRDAKKSSPIEMECVAVLAIRDARDVDVVGELVKELSVIQSGKMQGIPRFGRKLLKHMKHIGNGKPGRSVPVSIAIPTEDNQSVEHFAITPELRKQADRLYKSISDVVPQELPTSEYVAIEGLLDRLECSWRTGRQRFVFELVERDTNDVIICTFPPELATTIGAEGNVRMFVEGYMTITPDGKKTLDVRAHRAIPTPISTEELHRLKLRTPDGEDTVEYIRNLRADFG